MKIKKYMEEGGDNKVNNNNKVATKPIWNMQIKTQL